jgi:hypothetical protein
VLVVIFRVRLRGLLGVVVRMVMVPVREMRLMAGFLVMPRLVMLGGLPVMVRRVTVVLCGFVMMFGG